MHNVHACVCSHIRAGMLTNEGTLCAHMPLKDMIQAYTWNG